MNESRKDQRRPGRTLRGAADANGYRRPLRERGEAGFSTNGGGASASGGGGRGLPVPDRLDRGMDRGIEESGQRPLAGWRLAVKTIAGYWAFYFLLATVRVFLTDAPGQIEMMRRRVVVALIGAALAGLIYLVLQRFSRSSVRTNIVIAALLSLPAAAVLAAANHYLFYVFAPLDAVWITQAETMKEWSVTKIVVDGAFQWYFFFAAWAAVHVALSYARQLRAADQRASVLAREAQEAQLRALRYQINPHFLFNTLNSLSSLVLAQRNETAERMLMNLSAFFRSTLSADPTADVPLSEEIGLQRLYLEIEQVRFPERLKVEIEVPEPLMGKRVPVLILQPVVENSVKYGVARSRKPVTVRISAFEEAGRLHLKVSDDGETFDPGDTEGGTGVGLANVCDRLKARFGGAAGCLHGPGSEGGYVVHIFLPVVSDD
jgi:hypothetical protein